MSKLKELRRLERAATASENEHKAAQLALDRFKAANPETVVGQCFMGPLALQPLTGLLAQARDDAKWLAKQCICDGPGSACDSVKARIVVLLEELCTRLEAR